jgi:hypothetical protein
VPPEKKNENEQPTEESKETSTDEQPKDDSQQDAPADEQPEDESSEENEESEEDGDEENEDGNDEGDELDLDRAKAKIAKANDEAKNLRSRLREAEQKLENAKSLEEVDEIIAGLRSEREESERALLIENVALKFKLPEKLQKRLTGTTREELEADAQELADLFGTDEDDEDVTLEGGLSPRGRGEDENDPRSLAQKHGPRGSKRR